MTVRVLNQGLAAFLLSTGTLLTLLSAAYLFFPAAGAFDVIENSPIAALGLGTAGALATGFALVIFNSFHNSQRSIAMSAAAGLALLAYFRYSYYFMAMGPDDFLFLEFIEAVAFTSLALIFFFVGLGDMNIGARFVEGAQSLWGAPRWVFFWVMFVLTPVNMAGLFFLDHPIGVATILSLIYIMLFNMPMLLMQKGVSRATSIPHVPPFLLIVVFAGWLLLGSTALTPDTGSALFYFIWCLFVVNLISLALDIVDSIRWVFGDRAVIPKR